MKLRSSSNYSGMGCVVAIVIGLFNLIIGGLLGQYVGNFWIDYFNLSASIPFIVYMLSGIFLGEVYVILAIITFIASFFM